MFGARIGARVRRPSAIGALTKLFLQELGIEVLSHVIAVGAASIADREIAWERINEVSRKEEILLSCADPDAEQRMKEEVIRFCARAIP